LIKLLLYRWLLPIVLSHACESRIPRSGDKGEKVNCYVLAVDKDSQPYFIANDINGDKLIGFTWDGESFCINATITLEELDSGELNITHFYGLSDITYTNIYDLAWNYITKLTYIRIQLYRYIDSTFQYFFNKRKLTTKRRMDLLRFMMDNQIDSEHKGIDLITLLSKIYTTRLFLHPSKDIQQEKLELYLVVPEKQTNPFNIGMLRHYVVGCYSQFRL